MANESTNKKALNHSDEKLGSSNGLEEALEVDSTESLSNLQKIQEEQALVRKLDKRILPIACLLYLFAYLDRTNLGNARLQGLPEDVLGGDPEGKLFDWVNSVFFFTYIIFQVPATVASKLFPPRYWMAAAAIGWGLSSTLSASSTSFGGLVTARLVLGIFEAGFGPSIPLYFSFFYTKAEMGLRMAWWFGFAAVAGAFGGLVAFGVQHVHTSISNWRLLFIIEGIPPIILGLVCIKFLPNRPESTGFFNERERVLALERINRGTSADTGAVVNKAHIYLAFKDWRIYTAGVIYFGLNCALASISAFLPTLIKTFGFSNALAQLLTVPPYAVAAVVLTLFSLASDKLQNRGLFMTIACCISGIGYLLLLTVLGNKHVKYFAVFCITSGTYTSIGVIIAWFAHNLGSETKKATGIPMFMAIGQCGSILGSHIFPTSDGPHYVRGFAISCGLAWLAAICAVILSLSYRMENARRDKAYGKPIVGEKVDTSELADGAPGFRYTP
ncbi:MFS general substrate transporter [Pluteus cervinus]|uniref:MFS general substrate transporter n=1 Tax=Pluteus cervinus TaxID=181527 RepID=A0ACD3APM3_9AGAR|nr:MFS general substrate transporter [Pluteus cervinus]